MCGTPSISALNSSLNTLLDHNQLRQGRLAVEASVLVNNGKSLLVFDPTSVLSAKGARSDLFSSQKSVWASTGLYKGFASITHSNPSVQRQFGDLVEVLPTHQNITQPLKSTSLWANAPQAVVFLVNDKSNIIPALGQLTAEGAAQLYKIGYDGSSLTPNYVKNSLSILPEKDGLVNKFKSLLDESNAAAYVVNVSRAGSSVDAILNQLSAGPLAGAALKPLQGLQISAVTKLSGVDAQILNPAGNMKEADYLAATSKLGAKLGLSK